MGVPGVTGRLELSSVEGTTQGDPISMLIYAIGIMPLIASLVAHDSENPTKQGAFADDSSGTGILVSLRRWWDEVNIKSVFVGYLAEPSKT